MSKSLETTRKNSTIYRIKKKKENCSKQAHRMKKKKNLDFQTMKLAFNINIL